ncbi:FadR/GntR family transcriptional regulator [Bosea psychrotolerans]|uniref:GntR family transcriptional regulator n=1 Tax=Bosea psychrotolerans TaxID=1871628 RepID=A0A2S4M0R6_9HYPH|nr:FadR/GntR family transcriptional regulator [Bosea psychrotolerans]POR48311.1 GntR family transcriptional regulator [Bosea psychrotolerans]
MKPGIVAVPERREHSNHAEVARMIAIDIIAGRAKEGSKLAGDAELMLRFGVSRPVLRESVKTLVAKGLLTTKARVGTVVRERAAWNMFDSDLLAWHLQAGIDRRFLDDLAEIRLAVEPRAAALAAERRTEADLAAMQREPSDSVAFANADLALHVAVANASGNPFMRSVGGVIDVALRASFLLSAPVEEPERDIVIMTHRKIVDAIAARDVEGAAEAMVGVIFNGLRRHGAARSEPSERLPGSHRLIAPSRLLPDKD